MKPFLTPFKRTRRNANNRCPRRNTLCNTSARPDYSVVFDDQRMVTGAIDDYSSCPNMHPPAHMNPP